MTGFILLWTALAVAALIAIGTIVFALTDKRLKITRSTVPRRKRWNTVLTAVLAVCGIVVAAAGILLSSGVVVKPNSEEKPRSAAGTSNELLPTIVVKSPQPDHPGDLAVVSCPQTIAGSVIGKIPSGDVLVVGSRSPDSPIWTFSSQVNVMNGHWSTIVYVGHQGDTGDDFGIVYFLMPSKWAQYLVNTFDQASPNASWWDATAPPPFAVSPLYQTVRRSTPGPSCSK